MRKRERGGGALMIGLKRSCGLEVERRQMRQA